MTTPSLSIRPLAEITGTPVVFAVRKGADGPEVLGEGAGRVAVPLADLGVSGGADEFLRLPDATGAAPSIALVGVGSGADAPALRRAATTAVRRFAGTAEIALAFPTDADGAVAAIAEGAATAAYSFDVYRVASAAARKSPVASIVIAAPADDADALAHAAAVAEATHLVKDLVMTPGLDLSPAALAERAVDAVTPLGVEARIWHESALAADGFGGILGVGQGSPRPPRLVRLDWNPAGARGHIALVGKGITFDTGGNSLKPAASMISMKYDMTGAATALGVVLAAARLGVPTRITAWLCIAENMPGGDALRPNDVITIRGGRTVEVLNTDAEGRLVLADGLVAAGEEQPDQIIDIATLTGAAKVAMGSRFVPVMGAGPLVDELVEAAGEAGESFWPMPLPEELRGLLDSDVADIANIKPGLAGAGMQVAGVFLKEFGTASDTTGEPIPWAHLDIAGAAWGDGSTATGGVSGPTGVALRALLRHAERTALKG